DWVNPEGQQYPHNLLKPLPLIPNNRGHRAIPFDHFINNNLEYLRGGASSRKYTTSVTKTKATDYGHIKWIEDLVPKTIFFIIAVQTPGSGISILLAVGTPSTGSGNLYCQWELSPGSRNALCILFRTEIVQQTFIQSIFMKWPFHRQSDSWLELLLLSLSKFKYNKEHLCPSCEQGKSKRASHPPRPVPNSRQRLHLLHMDLCGPIRIASINGKRYILVIVYDYSRYTWVHFLRSKDEAPEVIIKFLKRITVLLQTLVEAARTMLIFSRAPLFLWAEAIAAACFTQNRSIIHRRFNKTPYELINGRKLDISFLHVFGALCYPKNDREDIRKLGAKGDIGFFIGYSADSCAYRIFNRRSKKSWRL
nr:retrovirus-related Pol polyprotein from transposon TNT 1-94 [Tanacetum cinerariifolium]